MKPRNKILENLKREQEAEQLGWTTIFVTGEVAPFYQKDLSAWGKTVENQRRAAARIKEEEEKGSSKEAGG
jgi:hypothetical protein